ncbi:hypothetical protein PAHAL_7G349800 [Panicum hallii]|uniref:Uncharacterized protein n=1 Tax=Panicum hallii TaxID=206008 RepID=A0A2T8IEJ3_9POAL|nr:hypothetical protein PAHAL_7G349800 [Panicum hallii]
MDLKSRSFNVLCNLLRLHLATLDVWPACSNRNICTWLWLGLAISINSTF